MTAGALVVGLLLAAAAQPAAAEELGDFCTDRPGLGTPACTIDRGRVAVELGLAGWTLDRSGGSRSDTFVAGDLLVRYGLSNSLEAQVGWQALGVFRQRDAAGAIERSAGTGDVRLALRQMLSDPDSSGVAIALMPFVTLATGGAETGAGEWTAGLIVPLSYALSDEVELAATAEIDHAADADRDGHHLAYRAIVGVETALAESVGAALELAAGRGEARGELLGGLSLAWRAGRSFQLDAGASLGLSRHAPDVELSVGLARRF